MPNNHLVKMEVELENFLKNGLLREKNKKIGQAEKEKWSETKYLNFILKNIKYFIFKAKIEGC